MTPQINLGRRGGGYYSPYFCLERWRMSIETWMILGSKQFSSSAVSGYFLCSSHDNTSFLKAWEDGDHKKFWFLKNFIQSKRLSFPPSRLLFRCVWTGLSSLIPPPPPPRKIYEQGWQSGLYLPPGPRRRCLPCQPSSRCMQPCSPTHLNAGGCHQTSSLTSFVRCQTQQIFFYWRSSHPFHGCVFFSCSVSCRALSFDNS